MFFELLLMTPGSAEVVIGGVKVINKEILNISDFIKIGLMALLTIIVVKWGLNTMGMNSYAKDI